MELDLEPAGGSRARLRPYRREDAESLARHADDHGVWRNLSDAFPRPYTLRDAEAYIASAAGGDSPDRWAIEVDGEAAGGIGLFVGEGIERISAELGYWLGRAYWGRGIVTAAVRAVTDHALGERGLTRVYAVPYAHNVASHRVLEKAGFVLEGRMRRSAVKEGVVLDQLLYARVR